jgi:HTH-type transcriptional regulator/antitoxin HigA
MHYALHIALHQGEDGWEIFLDDLEAREVNDIEGEADQWAAEALIPAEVWEGSGLSEAPTVRNVIGFAEKYRVHPAIPAVRIRRERRNYKLLGRLVGSGQVRELFLA